MAGRDGEFRALLTLVLTPGLGQTLIGRCVAALGSAEATLGASAQRLASIKGMSSAGAQRACRSLAQLEADGAVDAELDRAYRGGVTLLPISDARYPRLLRLIPDPPLLLWVRGTVRNDDALALAVVGSRKCSPYGREQADRIAGQCAASGLCIVSGGAYGIDVAAHRAALRSAGRTIAVIGSGLDRPYPNDHAPLFERIVAQERGAILSEFPMLSAPRAENFPRRNRIISGLALGVLVIEAARRSGALITARRCVEDHGRECMALPGRVDAPASAGCHQIIREGMATLVTSHTDVLDQLGEAGQLLKVRVPPGESNGHPAAASINANASSTASASHGQRPSSPGPSLFEHNLTASQQAIVGLLDAARSFDEIVAGSGVATGRVQSDLTLLEVRGVVRRRGGVFVRRGSGG